MHVYLEMRAGCQGKSGTLRGKYLLNLQLVDYSANICINLRSGTGSVACDENREMLRGTVVWHSVCTSRPVHSRRRGTTTQSSGSRRLAPGRLPEGCTTWLWKRTA